ncbi:hypothetical protein A2U01_0051280, partial [Trifolium medium]|nr:hypothetical protein [Trifolium medium]
LHVLREVARRGSSRRQARVMMSPVAVCRQARLGDRDYVKTWMNDESK